MNTFYQSKKQEAQAANTPGIGISACVLGNKGAQQLKQIKERIERRNTGYETIKNDQARFLLKLNMYLPYELAISHLGICQREMKAYVLKKT